jgi:flagellum-specific ATP synthase
VSLELLARRAVAAAGPRTTGRVSAVVGLTITIAGLQAPIGELVEIHRGRVDLGNGELGPLHEPILAEVVASRGHGLSCLPLGPVAGIASGMAVTTTGAALQVPVGNALLGRVLDGLGRPLDGGPSLHALPHVGLEHPVPNPLLRGRVDRPLALGVRALDTLVSVGRGQRLGVFAGSGVGKSTLLSMIARGTQADVNVIALVGERGREVREFLENDLGPEGLARSVVVVATSDQPPVVRLRAPFVATRIAETFRDQGADVLLMMDSVTRVAMAQREVGLSVGEPPATRGYPPSVWALLPRLLERAGPGEVGSITGIYTVLVEGDDMNEPIADAARSILDGHIVLDRSLATSGHYPSIDVLESVSRVTGAITDVQQRRDATDLRTLLAAYREARTLIEIGAYVPGTNPLVDRGRALMPEIDRFLCQAVDEVDELDAAWARLHALMGAAV